MSGKKENLGSGPQGVCGAMVHPPGDRQRGWRGPCNTARHRLDPLGVISLGLAVGQCF